MRCRQLCLAQDEPHALLVSSDLEIQPPEDLVAQVLRATDDLDGRAPSGRTPVLVMALLAASGLLFMMLGSPGELLTEGATWGRGLSIAAGVMHDPIEVHAWIAAPGVALTTGLLLVVLRQRSRHH